MRREIASTIVVTKGLAVTAGSKPSLFTKIGRLQPTSFAQITVTRRVRETMIEITTGS